MVFCLLPFAFCVGAKGSLANVLESNTTLGDVSLMRRGLKRVPLHEVLCSSGDTSWVDPAILPLLLISFFNLAIF